MGRSYTPQQRVEALAALELNGGALRATARQVGVPAPTLQVWRDSIGQDVQAAVVQEERPDYVALWADTMERALAELGKKMPAMAGKDLAISAGIASDKLLDHRDGRKGSAVTFNQDNRTQKIELGPDTPRPVLEWFAAQFPEEGAHDAR